jgi:asparagine synthetase B (glutamine-hydrolysing)
MPTDEAGIARELENCVRLHLASDVPLAVFLSGGVDSSAVANLAQKSSPVPVHTFTLAFGEEEFNEGPIARRIADAIGTQHQEVVLTEQHFISQLDAALDSLDQPTFDGLNSYYMSHAVRQAGFKVALVGTGGDELFGGIHIFPRSPGNVSMVQAHKLDAEGRDYRVGKAGVIDPAAIERFNPAADQVGQASGNDSTRRQSPVAVSTGVCVVLAGISKATAGGCDARNPRRRPASRHAVARAHRDAIAVVLVGDQHYGTAPVSR